jgi:hypothetical protein
MTTITVTYSSIDGCRKSRKFKTIAGARAFAKHWVGDSPEISSFGSYAVSFDGVGKVTASGITLQALFYGEPATAEGDVGGYTITWDEGAELYRIACSGRELACRDTMSEAQDYVGECRQYDKDLATYCD